MSSGAALQLAARGIEDERTSGSPETTFFKSVYRRHTNFALQPLRVNFNATKTALGNEHTIDVPRGGDLLLGVYLKVNLPALALTAPSTATPVWTNSVGTALIERADFMIGGQVVQEMTSEYDYIQTELRTTESRYAGLQRMTGRADAREDQVDGATTLIMPLNFYFNWDPALAVPIVALSRQDVQIKLKLRSWDQLIQSYGAPNVNLLPTIVQEQVSIEPFAEFAYLDTPERERFESGAMAEYLFDQMQSFDFATVSNLALSERRELPFSHLVKELFVTVRDVSHASPDTVSGNHWFDFTDVDSVELFFNGETRLAADIGTSEYLKYVQPMRCHTRVPSKNIYSYSFAIKPESPEPTGAANFSRLRSKQMVVNLPAAPSGGDRAIRVFATSLNVLRIADGIGGLIFK